MKLFDGMDQVRRLTAQRQAAFEQFFTQQFHTRLYPAMVDLNIGFGLVGAVLDALIRAVKQGSSDVVHPLSYVYMGCLILLALCNRLKVLRSAYPVMAYASFFLVASFSYLAFTGTNGDVGIFISLALFLTSLGFTTMSILHVSIILLLNLVMLYGAVTLIAVPNETMARFMDYLSNWFFLFCMFIAGISALFNRWLFRNVFALQFLLDERNQTLSNTVQLLHSTEEQLIQQQKHQALSHMASGLLHELVNPVNSALQALGFAKARCREDEVNEAIDDAMLNQKRIAAIISDLRAFAQDSAPAAREQVALDTLIDQALKLCAAELASIEIQREGRIDKPVACFPNALTQVLVNLLLNASDALKERKKTGGAQIRIRVQSEAGLVRICLHDNGKGIAPEHLKRLAEPFYSIDKDGPNMGLGLSICQTIMSHHDGRMWIKSEPGNWTEICLELPELTRI